ncbi:hypothetical protein Tco_0967799, partial [Tanacetum coccineum]
MDDLFPKRTAKFTAFQQEIDTLKETLSNHVKENEFLSKTLTVFKTESKEKESKYIDKEIVLEKQNKELENIIFEAPHELLKVSLVNESLKKLNYQLANFDKVVKNKTTSDAITTVFCRKNDLEIQIKQLQIDNDQLLNQIMSQDIMHIAMNSIDNMDVNMSCVTECCKCLELETELFKKNDFIDKKAYDKLVKRYSTLEKHCFSLELATQLNQEIFQKENSSENLNAPTFNQLFEINELKAQSQEKDTTIRKFKEKIKLLSGKANVENVKMEIDEMEKINIDLEHSVAKLLSENENLRKEREHLKSTFKEHSDSLIAQINAKKLKGKSVIDSAMSKPSTVTIAPGMFKINLEPLAPKVLKNKDSRIDFIKHTMENADILRELVKNARDLSPLDSNLDSASDTANNSESTHLWGSNATDVPSSSSLVNDRSSKSSSGTVRFGNTNIARIMGYDDYQVGNVTISRVYYVEGLGHNLFFVGQFCDADLEVAFRKNLLYS